MNTAMIRLANVFYNNTYSIIVTCYNISLSVIVFGKFPTLQICDVFTDAMLAALPPQS